MIAYYFDLALRSFRRNKVLTALMVCAIALGIGASMTTMTVLHVLSGDPIPSKSGKLHRVQIDPGAKDSYRPGEEPAKQVTRFDGEALLKAKRGVRQALMTAGDVAVEPERNGVPPFYARVRYTSVDFFAMFDVPFVSGTAWTGADDEGRGRVAVVSKKLSEKLFGAEDAIGRSVRLAGESFRIAGVVDDWRPSPHFYDLNTGRFSETEELFIPFSTSRDLDLDHSGSMSCWGDSNGDQHSLTAPCVWIQFWVELEDDAAVAAYRDFLVSYSEEQLKSGRFERPANVRLRDVNEWLAHNEVVPGDVRLQAWLAFGFLLVCLLNTVGLLLATFMRRTQEIGVRRALGASRTAVFGQLLVEAGAVGLVGAAFGLGLVYLGLAAVRAQPTSYAEVVHLDSQMLFATIGLAVFASVLAAILPAWRACVVSPALQVKTQ